MEISVGRKYINLVCHYFTSGSSVMLRISQHVCIKNVSQHSFVILNLDFFFLVGTMQWMLPSTICSTNFSSTAAYIAPEEPWGIPAGRRSGTLPSQIPGCHNTIRIPVIATLLGLTSCRFPPYQGMCIPYVVLILRCHYQHTWFSSSNIITPSLSTFSAHHVVGKWYIWVLPDTFRNLWSNDTSILFTWSHTAIFK